MIDNVIENVKNLSQNDLAKFKKWFDTNYYELWNSKINPDNISKFVQIGDEICKLLGTVAFPISGVGKCWDDGSCRVCEDCEMWEIFEEYLYSDDYRPKIPDYIWDRVVDMTIEMYKIGDRSWYFSEKDAYDCSPGKYKYIFYIKGGKKKEVNDIEFETCMKQG